MLYNHYQGHVTSHEILSQKSLKCPIQSSGRKESQPKPLERECLIQSHPCGSVPYRVIPEKESHPKAPGKECLVQSHPRGSVSSRLHSSWKQAVTVVNATSKVSTDDNLSHVKSN